VENLRDYKKPVFTQKHFCVIAEIFRESRQNLENPIQILNRFIETFEKDNKKFSRKKFDKAVYRQLP
jgi:hypothetical protein